LANV
jgi:hypothetical protein